MQTQTITQIPLERLHPHPKNANVMPAKRMKKLARHIEATGNYEPLVVRPHPAIAGGYELINGHHRARVLKSLGHAHASCIVWNLDDAQTLLLLATINRLGGEDAPGRRLDLLDALAESLQRDVSKMAALLPEEEEMLAKLLSPGGVEPIAPPPPLDDMPEAFTVFVTAGQKRELLAALAKTHANPAAALLQWAAAHR